MNKIELAKMIDQTLLSPLATENQVEKFCIEADGYGFASVCINPVYVKFASEVLKDSCVKTCTVIDFPLGAGGKMSKILQAENAVSNGADELDFVIDMALVKMQNWNQLEKELTDIKSAVDNAKNNVVTKLILETCVLSDAEIVESCKCAMNGGFDFVKTSTGFYLAKDADGRLLPNGATVHAVSLMKKTVGSSMGVKASGSIHSTVQALELIKAGATRIGASAGCKIVDGLDL